MTKQYVVFVGCSSRRQGPRALAQARSLGLNVILLDTMAKLSSNPDLIESFDAVLAVSTLRFDESLCQLREKTVSCEIIGFYTFEEFSVEVCAQLASEYGLPGNPVESVRVIRNKHLCRRLLTAGGLRQPGSHVCTSLEEAEQLIATDEGRWVIKPLDSAGSQGVSFVDSGDISSLQAAFCLLKPSQQSQFLVEEYVDGKEYSIEGFFLDCEPVVIGITEKETARCIETMHTFPADVSERLKSSMIQSLNTALNCVGLHFGNFHVECWVSDGEVVLGEIHARPGGDYIHLLTELVTGVETYRSVLVQLLNENRNETSPLHRAGKFAAVKYFPQPEVGRVRQVAGYDELKQDAAVYLSELSVNVGDTVCELVESSNRVGSFVVIENTMSSLKRKANELVSKVRFYVD